MGTRGRKSKNDLALAGATDVAERMRPPASLTDAEKFEWLRIVNEFPAEYFNSGQVPMLKQYVRHLVHADAISEQIQLIMEPDENGILNAPLYDKLLKMQERETRAMASLGIRLGFAKSAHREQGAKKGGHRNPWE
jgi:hypothetical protein